MNFSENNMFEPWVSNALRNDSSRIVITGAGGWLGLEALDMLSEALGGQFFERVHAFGSAERELVLRNGKVIRQLPLSEIITLPKKATLVLHTAFVTKERVSAMESSEYRRLNEAIRKIVLEALEPIGAEAVFVASSGAAGKLIEADITPAMRLYGEMKLEDECAFARWARDAQRTAVIVRLYALVGPRMNKLDEYAISSFMLDALAGRAIEVRAPHRVERAYVAVSEIMSLVFSILLSQKGVVCFDSGGIPLELECIANIVSEIFPESSVMRSPIIEKNADLYHGDSLIYKKLLDKYNITPVPLRSVVKETVEYIKNRKF